MKRLLTLAALIATLGLPPATAWEREAFEVLKKVTKEQIEREKAAKEKAAREQAAKEQAERDEQERAAREQAVKEQAERDRIEREKRDQERAERRKREQAEREKRDQERAERRKREQAEREKERQERAEREKQERAAREREYQERAERRKREQAERERAEQEAEMARQAERERQRAEQLCNDAKFLADDFSIVEYAQGKGVLTPDEVKELREHLKACNLDIQTAAGDPSCRHYMFALGMQEDKTFSDRRDALEAQAEYEGMNKLKHLGLLKPMDEMKVGKLKKDMREKRKAKSASQRKFEILYREAEEAGCLDEQSD